MMKTTTQPKEEPHSAAPCAAVGIGQTPLQAARFAGETRKETRMSDEWETFCDVGYYHMWRLRRKTERGWNDGFHINTKAEAEGLSELLNKLERELAAVTEQRDRLRYGREFFQSALNEQGDILTKVIEQRDRLAEALRELCETLLKDKPRDITELLNNAGDALAAVKGGPQ